VDHQHGTEVRRQPTWRHDNGNRHTRPSTRTESGPAIRRKPLTRRQWDGRQGKESKCTRRAGGHQRTWLRARPPQTSLAPVGGVPPSAMACTCGCAHARYAKGHRQGVSGRSRQGATTQSPSLATHAPHKGGKTQKTSRTTAPTKQSAQPPPPHPPPPAHTHPTAPRRPTHLANTDLELKRQYSGGSPHIGQYSTTSGYVTGAAGPLAPPPLPVPPPLAGPASAAAASAGSESDHALPGAGAAAVPDGVSTSAGAVTVAMVEPWWGGRGDR